MFLDALSAVRERNRHDDPEAILQEMTEEVKADRLSAPLQEKRGFIDPNNKQDYP